MSAVQGAFRNDDPKPVCCFRSDKSVNAPIRLTINEIVEMPGFAFMPPLIHNSAALEVLRKQIIYLTRCRLTKFSFFNVGADNDVRPESLGVTPFHIIHEACCGLQRRLVKEIIVIAQSRRPCCEDSDEKQ